ncbi:MAG: hypothetical protein ABI615_06815, partial [Chthoniobacterales bacterium]
DLSQWPAILPHYRYIHYLERGQDRHIVKMAAIRDFIPISWVSEQIIDRDRMQVRFRHLKAFTKGMEVVWTFQDQADGVFVAIIHELNFRIPTLAPIADKVIGEFFIDNIANKTLRAMKRHLETPR